MFKLVKRGWVTPMDYDDNDFESQNRQLAGEGSTKFPTVLRSYALPKFDFDDSLQGHLRFDNLVETEVFLGIESQEDNRWIEDFSQGSSGIEFTSSATESCPILRRNNVWSEATSSESVEMLLKSVGQEEMIPGQTIIEESDACDQLGSSTKQIEPSLNLDDNILSGVQDVIDSSPTFPPDKFLESLSGLNEDSGGLPLVVDVLRAHEGESSGQGNSRDLDPDAVDEKSDFPVVEGNQLKDGKFDDANQRQVDSLCNEALHNRTLEDSSASKMQIDNLVISMQTSGTRIEESNTEDVTRQTIYSDVANEAFTENDHDGEGELHVLSKETQIDHQNMHGCALNSGSYIVEKPLSVALHMKSVGEKNTVETSLVNVEPSSSMIVQGNSDLEMVEECSDRACPVIPVQDSKCEVMGPTEDTHISDQFNANMHERSPVALEGDSNFEVHAVEIDNINSGIGANIELKIQSYVQIKDGHVSVSEGTQYLEESGKHMDSVISASKPAASLLFVEGNKFFKGECEQRSNSVVGDTSSSKVVSSSAELEAHGSGNLEGVPDTLGVSGEGFTGEGHGSSSRLVKSEKCEENVVPGQGSVSNNERGCGSGGDEVIVCKAQSGTAAGKGFAPDDSLKNVAFTSNDTLDGGPMSSGNAVTSLEVVDHKDDEKLTSHVGGVTQLDNKEEVASDISVEASVLIFNECSQVVSELGSVSESGNDACCGTAGELINEALDRSQIVENCNTASRSEPQEAVADKVGEDRSNEQETCPVPCDSTVKEDVVAVVALKSHEEDTAKEIFIDASLKGSESIVNNSEMLSQAVPLLFEESGSQKDAAKPICGSPTVINCAEISKQENEIEGVVKGPLDQNVTLTDVIIGESNKVCSVSLDVKDDVSKDQGGFSFDISSLADLDKRDAGKNWHQSTTIPASKIAQIVERSPSVSGLGQVDSRKAQKISHGSPQATKGDIVFGGSRTPERKTRRASGRAAGKESARKRNHEKGTTPVRHLEQVDKACIVSPNPNFTCQLVQSEGMQHTGHVEQSSKKPTNVLPTPTSILPDLNTSASLLAVFQQPFTDLQQVQLRAQIFVYGSLIQGTTPEEACMISAFGGLDGGRSIWENAWRLSVERLRDQKSNFSNPETPLQPLSGSRAADHGNKQGARQSKMIYSPAGVANSKSTPSPIVNSIIPLSSPLWSISTPSGDALQSCAIPRSAVMDPNQAPSPLHSYLTPAMSSFVGQTWVSQPPFPGPWVASPQAQATAFDSSLRFSTFPMTEPVKFTPVRELSGPHASTMKHISPSPIVQSGGLTSVYPGTSMMPDVTKATVSAGQDSANPKSRKRKKAPVSEDLGHISLPPQIRTCPVSASGVTSHFSTSVVAATPPGPKTTKAKFVPAASTITSFDQSKIGNRDVEQKVILSEETLNNVKEAKLQAENAATLAAAAVNHSQVIWDQLDKQKNSGMIADGEAKLASAAVAIAAAASVAKAAAAAAKVAADAALQAKLMAEEAMITSGAGIFGQNNIMSLSNGVNVFGDATPASILKGQGGMDSSGSIIIAAREAARRRVEAASAASKRAENLDAIVKAAELAAEAVTQAGIVVAMGNPLALSELVEAGPEGYWRVPQVPSELAVNSNNSKREQSNTGSVEHDPESSAQHVECVTLDQKEPRNTSYGKPPTPRELSMVSMEDHMRLVDGSSGFVTKGERDLRGQKGSKVSDLAKTVGVFPESNIGSRYTSIAVENEQEKAVGTVEGNGIKEGSLVEVFKDGDGSKAAWFLASVSSLKDGEAYVCYTEIPSGSGQLKEWVPLNVEGDKAPRIRIPHPMTTMQFEGAKKRRRAAMGNYNWSVGDKVDACIQDCWCEGVVTEKNKKDETSLTVHFPAGGETTIVRAWQLRPSVFWKDGQWIEWSNIRENNPGSHEGDTPREKRIKLGSPAAEAKEKERVSTDIGVVELGVPEDTRLSDLCANDKIFNIGRNTRDETKPEASRTVRSGLQKEGSRVIFGVPKPGKTRKFMEVSKHYDIDKSIKASGANNPVKRAKVQMPPGSGSRGWRNTKFDFREKQPAESKPRVLKAGKAQSVPTRTIPPKVNLFTSGVSATHDGIMMDHRANLKDTVTLNQNASGKQSRADFGSFLNNEGAADGPIIFSSLPAPPDAVSSKKVSTSNLKSERASKGRLAPSGGKLAKIQEDKVYNGNAGKSVPDSVEPRRSNRRIQPTSRLLEGLQSSLSISKIPAVSHDRGVKVQNRSTSSSRGNNHG